MTHSTGTSGRRSVAALLAVGLAAAAMIGTATPAFAAETVYKEPNFTSSCAQWSSQLSVIFRDLDVTAPGSGTYKYDEC